MAETIMVIDDSQKELELMEALLNEHGYQVYTADCAEKALVQINEVSPDLILLDILMPRIDGFELCGRLKQQAQTVDIPIIFLSGVDTSLAKVRGLELGAVDYITKPFDLDEVLARIKIQLRVHRLNNSLQEANAALWEKQQEQERDLQSAAHIQATLIPRIAPDIPSLTFAWHFKPCEKIGGDLFNALSLSDEEVALYVLDVSGHGLPSAMVTFSIAQFLAPEMGFTLKRGKRGSGRGLATPPAELMSMLENEFPMERFDRYFTICYMLLNHSTGRLRYSSAGHPPRRRATQ